MILVLLLLRGHTAAIQRVRTQSWDLSELLIFETLLLENFTEILMVGIGLPNHGARAVSTADQAQSILHRVPDPEQNIQHQVVRERLRWGYGIGVGRTPHG